MWSVVATSSTCSWVAVVSAKAGLTRSAVESLSAREAVLPRWSCEAWLSVRSRIAVGS